MVADPDRTEKTICLAVSPSLKALGVKNRCRVFEIPQDIPFITARPRMRLYMEYSARIYGIYLRYAAPEDIHVYSIDEVFLDITGYLAASGLPREMAQKILLDVFNSTGITATAGIGTNLYLAKVAMDIVAKRLPPDERGARIAQLDELGYRRAPLGSPAPDRLLAGGPGVRPKAGGLRPVHHGGHRPVFPGPARRLAQPGAAVPAVRRQRRAADRPRLGLGELHPPGHQGLPARHPQPGLRPGAPPAPTRWSRPGWWPGKWRTSWRWICWNRGG